MLLLTANDLIFFSFSFHFVNSLVKELLARSPKSVKRIILHIGQKAIGKTLMLPLCLELGKGLLQWSVLNILSSKQETLCCPCSRHRSKQRYYITHAVTTVANKDSICYPCSHNRSNQRHYVTHAVTTGVISDTMLLMQSPQK